MENWFPKIFDDVKCFNPIEGENIFVSELTTYETVNGIKSTKDYQLLLIEPKLIKLIKPDEINPTTKCSVHPIYNEDYEYKGNASVFISGVEGLNRVEPFIISWESANYITFQPDPYFLLTYGLTPRLTQNQVYWDDLSRPKTEIISSIPVSHYDFPNYSKSFVKVNKEYLQDYLMLRKKSLIQVYCETRIFTNDFELSELLGDKEHFEKTTANAHFRIIKTLNNEIIAEVTGYRLVDIGKTVPISSWKVKEIGHVWPGYTERISRINAKHWDYVYVSDEVLDKYEQDERYDVYPETGGVNYINQWSVTRCSRIGRNHIKIELFKLYEGTPNEVVDYWNKFAVNEAEIDKKGKNISERAKELVFSYLQFGEMLSSVFSSILNVESSSQELIGINWQDLNYHGWYNNKSIKSITNHLNHVLSKSSLLTRLKLLNTFLVESINEKLLRRTIQELGIDINKFKKSTDEEFRNIKLLNFVLNYLVIAKDTGLHIKSDSPEINSRLVNELKELEIIKLLLALNAMRQLDSHSEGTKSEIKLTKAFESYGIDKKEFTGNYLNACELIYDKLIDGFNKMNRILSE
jgi:hypothetical protein